MFNESFGGVTFSGWAFVPFLCVGGLIVFAGLAVAVRSVIAMRRSALLTRTGVAVEGRIIDNQMESRESTFDAGTPDMPMTSTTRYFVFRPVIKFRTQAGQEIFAVAPRVSRRSFIVGATVPLLYLPDRPDQIKIVTGGGGSAVPGLVVGLLVAGLATTFLLAVHSMFFASSTNPAGSDCPPGLNLPAGATCSSR